MVVLGRVWYSTRCCSSVRVASGTPTVGMPHWLVDRQRPVPPRPVAAAAAVVVADVGEDESFHFLFLNKWVTGEECRCRR